MKKKFYRKLGFVCHIDLQTIKAPSIKAVSIPSQVACRRVLVFVPRKFAPFREAAGIDFTRNIIAKVLINRTIVFEFFAGGGVNRRLFSLLDLFQEAHNILCVTPVDLESFMKNVIWILSIRFIGRQWKKCKESFTFIYSSSFSLDAFGVLAILVLCMV